MQCRRPEFDLWIGKIPWRREWKLILVFLPAESHGQRRLEGYSPCGHSQTCLNDEHFDFSIVSAVIMFRQDCLLSAMRILTPDHVLCSRGRGDLGADWVWPLSWKTPCLCRNVSAQRSGVWSCGGLLWVMCPALSGVPWPSQGSVLQ